MPSRLAEAMHALMGSTTVRHENGGQALRMTL
jgi:hypothetical protein